MERPAPSNRAVMFSAAAAAFLFWLVLWSAAAGIARGAPDEGVGRLILQAGEAEEDRVRLEILRQLRAMPELDPKLAADCDKMIAAVERWITSKQLPYFGSEVSRRVDYDFGIAPDSPFYPLTCIYRGRMLVWVTLESGGI
ncbi:MAG TPA: hypothetical protein EYP56_07135, partial [Planctomycetaceae bacterium]|nr:hypothetical protein [Planctomycetaceae bacterium]